MTNGWMRAVVTCCLSAMSLPALAVGTELQVRVEGVPRGPVIAYLYRSGDGMLGDGSKAWRRQQIEAADGATFTFADVPAGPLVVVVFHDANGNGQMDRNFLGMPSEPVAMSGKPGGFGPPTFARCAVPIAGARQRLTLRLKTIR